MYKVKHISILLLFSIALMLLNMLPACGTVENPDESVSVEKVEGKVEGQVESLIPVSEDIPEDAIQSGSQDSDNDALQEIIDGLTLEQKVAQLFVITPEALTDVDQVVMAGTHTKECIEAYPVGGLIYMSGNLTSVSQTKEMLQNTMLYSQEAIGLPIFLAVDEEGGTVTRVAQNSNFQIENVGDMRDIGATGDPAKAYEAGAKIGSYLSELGFNVDFAPVADVVTNSKNQVVAKRSFGTDPVMVSDMVQQEVIGLRQNGIIPCVKHFPGHGATAEDTHEGIAVVSKNWDDLKQAELIPFIDSIDQDIPMIMVGHFSLEQVTGDYTPCSLSEEVITHRLREELGYEGIVITDALNMAAISNIYSSDEAAIKAILAGADLLLMPQDFKSAYEGVLSAVRSGEISEERIDESVERIIREKQNM